MPDVPNTTCTRCGRDLRTLVAQSCATCGVGPLRTDFSAAASDVVVVPDKSADKAKSTSARAQRASSKTPQAKA